MCFGDLIVDLYFVVCVGFGCLVVCFEGVGNVQLFVEVYVVDVVDCWLVFGCGFVYVCCYEF